MRLLARLHVLLIGHHPYGAHDGANPGLAGAVLALWAISCLVMVAFAARLPEGLLRQVAEFLPSCVTTARALREHLDVPRRAKVASVHDEQIAADALTLTDADSPALDPVLDASTLALVRLAALVAVGGAGASSGAHADAAVAAGATTVEMVEVPDRSCSCLGLARVVAAGPQLALALGCDVDAFEIRPHA